jgi:hypothetical protein
MIGANDDFAFNQTVNRNVVSFRADQNLAARNLSRCVLRGELYQNRQE